MGTAIVVNSITFGYDGGGAVGYIIRQQYTPAAVLINATRIKVLFERRASDWTLSSAWIGHQGATGFTFDGGQVQLKFGGNNGAAITADTFSDEINFAVDETKTLIVSFRISVGTIPFGTITGTDHNTSYASSGGDAAAAASTFAGDAIGTTGLYMGTNGVLAIVLDTAAVDATIEEPTCLVNVARITLAGFDCLVVEPSCDISVVEVTIASINCKISEPSCLISFGGYVDCRIVEPHCGISTQHTILAEVNCKITDPHSAFLAAVVTVAGIDCTITEPFFLLSAHDRFYVIDCEIAEPSTSMHLDNGEVDWGALEFQERSYDPIPAYLGNIERPGVSINVNSGSPGTILSYSRR